MNNIKEKLNYLKSITNKKEYTEEELKLIEIKFKEFYEDLVIFLVSKKDTYYGYIIMNLELNIDFRKDIIAGVTKMDKLPFILIINPLLFLEFTLKEMLFILCHEIEHLVLNHPTEMKRLNPSNNIKIQRLLNYAMDASINQMLINSNFDFIKCPENCITLDTIRQLSHIEDLKDLESYLYYYNYIKHLINIKPIDLIKKYKISLSKDQIITPHNSKTSGEEIFDLDIDSEQLNEIIKKFLKKINDDIKKNKGNLSYNQSQNLQRILSKSKINWQHVLRQYIGNVNEGYKKTKTRLNRRQPNRFDLSGKINNKIIKLVVAIDTSGSVSNEQLEQIMNEIYNILKNRKFEITLIQCDMTIKDIKKIKSINQLSKITKIKGRGGTSFKPVIEYINKNPYYKDSILIYFTDGFGDKEISKPKTYKNLWVVLKNINNLSLEQPYGRVMKL